MTHIHYLLVALVIVAQLTIGFSANVTDDSFEERLIGWKGETANEGNHVNRDNPWIETISWDPRAFIYHHFLTHEECDHFINLAKNRLRRSQVVSKNGMGQLDPIRTSYSTRVLPNESKIVKDIARRIAEWTHLPENHAEPFEVLKYVDGQKYDAHWDWFDKENMRSLEGNRVATVLIYLSDVESRSGAGGETALPLAQPLDPVRQSVHGLSACANRSGIAVVPRKGDVLLFWDAAPDGVEPDRHTLHASCPTFKGEKWTATRWIHSRGY